ncbi:hypothetical protein D3C72_1880250 [compost metagenome]
MMELASTDRTGNRTGGNGFFCSMAPASRRLPIPRATASQKAIQGKAPTIRKVPTAWVLAPSPKRMENTMSKTR